MQEYIDNIKIDYRPVASKYLSKLESLLAEFTESRQSHDFYISEMIKPVMELKATGGMFNEDVVASVSGTVLSLLENSDMLDDDLLDIVIAHNTAVNAAVELGVRSMDDHRANALIMEVRQACVRYQSKKRKKAQA